MTVNHEGKQYLESKPKNFSWYLQLRKPPLNPPSFIFPVAWTILYILIIISGIIYLKKTQFQVTYGIIIYVVQWIFNLIWSPLFFRMKLLFWSVVDIVLLWLSILLTILQFQKTDAFSAQLLYPYLAWVSFATYLNSSIYWLNRQ